MYYIVDSEKTFEDAAKAVEVATKDNNFGVLHIHNLGETLRSKGINFDEECKVFEVCNPGQAAKVMSVEMLSGLSKDEVLIKIAEEVENSMVNIVNAAR